MSENLHELCCSIVEEFYGQLHATLFSCLTYYGRLSATQLAQKSRMPLKHVKTGLAVLIQSRLIYYHITSDGFSTYQANTSTSYNLLRIGRLIELARTRLGEIAATVVTEAFLLGFATITELEYKVSEKLLSKPLPLTNGNHDKESSESIDGHDIRMTIDILLDEGYLLHVRSASFQTAHDVRMDAEAHIKDRGMSTVAKGRKAVEELNNRIDIEVRRRTTTQNTENGFVPDPSTRKRHLQEGTDDDGDDDQASKRHKINGMQHSRVNGYRQKNIKDEYSEDGILVSITFDNLISRTRDCSLLAKSKKSLSRTSRQVLMGALSQIRTTEQWTASDEANSLDINSIQNYVNRIERNTLSNGHKGDEDREVDRMGSRENHLDNDQILYNEVDRNLAALADSEFIFLHGAYGKDWKIDKHELDNFVREEEILRLMQDRMQAPALRIIRMLRQKGKLDEKTLQEIGLLSAKDLRQTLAQLKQMGFIDLQEVPRESQRQPNRTIYLWFYDAERTQKVLLNNLYKAMARLMQRMKLERRKLSTTLEKVERTDVQGNEEQSMSAPEVRVLRRWRRKEQWVFEQLNRLDESVALLRDI